MNKVRKGAQNWLLPLPALLIGAMVNGKPNFMTAAWASIANAEPPMLCVAIRRSRYTRKGIQQDGELSVNVATASQARQVDFCGIESGAKTDKAARCGFTVFYGTLPNAPLIQECPLNLECKVSQIVELPTHSLIIAQIAQSHVAEHCLTGGKLDAMKLDPIIYLTSPHKYARLGDIVGDAFSAGMTL
ncbi:MAG: flavin reductase family protein [Dehalococcoidia bacterium]|nr:flavin reductase family protein [Dehalococcoidia bacterium]